MATDATIDSRPRDATIISPPHDVTQCYLLLSTEKTDWSMLLDDETWFVFCEECDEDKVLLWDFKEDDLFAKIGKKVWPQKESPWTFLVKAEHRNCGGAMKDVEWRMETDWERMTRRS